MRELSKQALLALAERALADEPKPVPLQAIRDIVADHLSRRETFLKAVREHGSPLYALDVPALRNRAAQFSRAFKERMPLPVRIFYAIKSNAHPGVVKTLLACGLGLDVSSGRELELALSMGADPIIFSGPGKTATELALAATQAQRVTVLMDSFSELEQLQNQAERRGVVVHAGVRLTANPHGLWRKFGIPLAQLNDFATRADACSHVRLQGLQFHTSWNLTPHAQVEFIATLGNALKQWPQAWVSRLRFIDIGGGYWPPAGEWLQAAGTPGGSIRKLLAPASLDTRCRYGLPGTPIEQFAEALSRAVAEHLLGLADLTVYLEPGRWLCHDGMHLLMTVVDRKADDLAITDAGTNAVGWERFETDYFPVINLTRPALVERAADIHGCLCTPHDLWGYSYWGEDLRPGDVLLIPSQGAYTYGLRQDFIKPLPTTAIIDTHPGGECTGGALGPED
jgi:diaminopimelate decarboxylase